MRRCKRAARSCRRYFNPRTPCGVRHFDRSYLLRFAAISIHAPLAGCDAIPRGARNCKKRFQSTHPLRGATRLINSKDLRAKNFNPRTPCGVRRWHSKRDFYYLEFQSTHPLRGATPTSSNPARIADISIHAPLAGCDFVRSSSALKRCISIHAPLAGCDLKLKYQSVFRIISIHAPLAGCDVNPYKLIFVFGISIHAPLAGCDAICSLMDISFPSISIHAPLAGCDTRLTAGTGRMAYFNPRTPCGVRPFCQHAQRTNL